MERIRVLVGGVALAVGLAATARSDSDSPRLFNRGRAPIDIGVPVVDRTRADAEACAGCHAEIAAEWEASFHRQAWTNEFFQAAYADEPRESCRNCHAPLRRSDEPAGIAAEQGVSCAVCHVRGNRILGTGRTRGGPHRVQRVAGMDRSGFCAGCHQFDFPADLARERGLEATNEPMQDTYEEWRASHFAEDGVECQDCHMPEVRGADGRRHASHAFPGSHDPAMLSRAVEVEIEAHREDDRVVVEARVVPAGVGHSFPTGDLFRRVELRIEGDDPADAHVVAFAREFADRPERLPNGELTFVRRERADTRLPPPGFGPPSTRRFELPASTMSVSWSLDHLLMPSPMAASYGLEPAVVRQTVHRGRISVEGVSP
jgi:hypothetical protein